MEIFLTQNWNCYLNEFNKDRTDIYFREEYVKLYEDGDHTAFCYVCREEDKLLLFPFLRGTYGNHYDIETAYGYGGPISNISDVSWISGALKEMMPFLKNENYICGFVRFHPLLNNQNSCIDNMDVIYDRNTVSIDTSETEEAIWDNQINSKNRNMIRKAQKNGLVYTTEYDFASLADFKELYLKTMERLDADEFYYFNDDYFDKFISDNSQNAFLGCVRKDEKLICAALFMYDGQYGHYHLEGSDYEYHQLGANNLLLWGAACEMNKLGVRHFHLGGGYDSNEDNSLYKFKKAFGKEINEFYIGKMIFDMDLYTGTKDSWAKANPAKKEKYGNRLLCYRY